MGVKDIVPFLDFYRNMGFEPLIRGPEDDPAIVSFKNEKSKIESYPLALLAKDINGEHPPKLDEGYSGIILAYTLNQKKK
ncbi:hypothetical protein [Bacillus marinisedimentorum]|uniref:hypothetical protein n=1 Tax=Bacillus marinisedimentorum TaxID=1821260 RepID=UPI001B80988B|nr:hypothetical protein [Bacillus marinisedimentorum]